MVGSAVETEHSSKDKKKTQVHIERITSQNLRLFLDGLVSCTAFLSFSVTQVMGRSLEGGEDITQLSVQCYNKGSME